MLFDMFDEIDYIYSKLYDLECKGNKNSVMFNRFVERLKIKLLEEEKLVSKFVKSKDYLEIKEELDLYDGSEKFFLRLKENVILYELRNSASYEFSEDYDDMEQRQMAVNVGKIYDCSSKNIFLLYAYFLDKAINALKLGSMRNMLLMTKYYNCVVKHNFEKMLVKNNFNLPDDIYTDLNLVIDLMDIDEYISESIILDGYVTSISDIINKLMINSDEDYLYNDSLMVVKINYQCLLKAVLGLMSEYEFSMLKDGIVESIRDLLRNDNIATSDGIIEIIDNRNKYRTMVRKLSLKPLKN